MSDPLGRSHPLIRRLRALRRDRALARSEGVFLAEGIHLAEEALAHGVPVEVFVASPRLEATEAGRELLARLRSRGSEPLVTGDAVLDGLQDARSPQPVLALVRRPEWPASAGLEGASPALVAVACGIQDPGNLGNLWRTADAAGATGLFVVGASADRFHPRTVRAGMGAVFRLPALELSLEELFARLERHGVATVAAVPKAGTRHDAFDLTRPCALFFGGEGAGLGAELVSRLRHRVAIPMRTGVESLSVGSAAAVLLFEAARQRRSAGGDRAR